MSACIVKLPVFEGPLDLLLHLVRKNKLNIFDLPMSLITEQYLAYLELMKALDLDIAGEYLLLAATLIYIKSQMLVPQTETEEREEKDPREEIVKPLVELARFQEAAQELLQRPIWGEDVFSAEGEEILPQEDNFSLSLFELLTALKRVLKRTPPQPLEVKRARILISQKIEEIMALLNKQKQLLLSSLFQRARHREEAISYFLALLELALREKIRLIQPHPWEEVKIIKK